MRRFLLLFIAILLWPAAFAGDKLSAPTRVFLQQRASGMTFPADNKSTIAMPKTVNGVEQMECFISLDGASITQLEAAGVTITGTFGDLVTACIPVDMLERVASIDGVKQVAIARKAQIATDVAKTIVKADMAWAGISNGLPKDYTGKDVVIGIIDDGIQFNHRAFLNADGTSRVKAVYMPNTTVANGGTKPVIDGVELIGYQYTTPSQIAALTTDDTDESHGTHTTGCAAGSQVGNYAGMAPEADLVLAGCGQRLSETAIVSSAKYIANYAKNVLGKPCVISISMGSYTGPHDGTSSICRAYKNIAEQYGAVILVAAGNEADVTGAAVKTLASDDDYMALVHEVTSMGSYYGGVCDLWNSTGDELQVKIIAGGTESDWMTTGTYGDVIITGGLDPNNGRFNLHIKNYSTATYVVKAKGGNTVYAYSDCYYSYLGTVTSSSGYTVTPGANESSMIDDMTSPKVISVGAQASKAYDGYGNGDVAYFSSYGVDGAGMNQPFITAPGHYVVSSLNGYNSGETYSWSTTFNGTTYKWGQMSGTSMATPIAAGVVVLYLQVDPSLDVDRVKDAITSTATAYPSSCTSPVLARGHGIINAFDGIEYILQHQGPTIVAKPSELNFEGYQGETYTKTFSVKGFNLTQPITISLSGDACYNVSHTTISAEEAMSDVEVTVTYAPTTRGESQATLSLTSEGAEPVAVALAGVAQPRVPTILTDPEALNFSAKLSTPITKTINVNGLFLNSDIAIALTDPKGVFTVSPTTIASNDTGIDTPVEISVTFNSGTEGEFTGSLTLTSAGAQTKTVPLTAKCNASGTASDPYLDIAKCETIDVAGATVSGMSSIYKYSKHDDSAWLTVSNYGARKADASQNWISCGGNDKNGSESWDATDVFMGSASYFTGEAYYTDWNENYQNFYVTNCSLVKQLAENRSNTTYPLVMYIYECTVNDDGSITAGSIAVQTKKSSTTDVEVLASDELDASKVYKVSIYNDFSKLYEIGFKTPVSSVIPGDVNGDGSVTSSDITALYNYLLNGDSSSLVNGDQDGDGFITSGDVTIVYNVLLGN